MINIRLTLNNRQLGTQFSYTYFFPEDPTVHMRGIFFFSQMPIFAITKANLNNPELTGYTRCARYELLGLDRVQLEWVRHRMQDNNMSDIVHWINQQF